MSNGLPSTAKVGIPGKYVNIDPVVYFTAKRLEGAGMLKPGQALMLAAILKPQKSGKSKRGKK